VINPQDIVGETFIAVSDHEADHMAYDRNLLPSSLTSRPLQGDAPTIDLVVGYKRMNTPMHILSGRDRLGR